VAASPGPEHVPPRRAISAFGPWLWLIGPWLLFELPLLLRGGELPAAGSLRLSLEPALLLSILGLGPRAGRAGRALRAALGMAVVCLVIFRVDQWICLLLMREEPLLYDQWFMARHLWVLIGDLMSPITSLVLAGVALLGFLLTRLVRLCLARARVLFAPERRAQSRRALLGGWVALLLLSLLPHPGPQLGWLSWTLRDNVRESRAVYRSVQRRLSHSPYAGYEQLALSERPDVLLFIVESYGRILSVEPELRGAHSQLLGEISAQLTRAGWHAASAFSTSTVSGGRSWIAEGTLLMGTPIRYEAVFQHAIAQRPAVPQLVSFLNRRGYESVLLAPADRDRAGAHVVNRYGFQRLLTYSQLGYRGPRIGWGIVPDQHSLAVAEQRALRARSRPVFLDFHMVSSHAPWSEVPVLSEVDARGSAREQNQAAPVSDESTPLEEPDGAGTVILRLSRYDRGERRFAYMKRLDAELRAGYQASIAYDLRLIAQYLARRSEDALVVVLGDHQPPVIAPADASFDSPIHVLSRSPRRLAELQRQGFTPGLALPASAPAKLTHAGLFSLLVRSLLASSCTGCPLPAFLPQGAPLQ
jgi:hypothetical protein